MIKEIRRYAGLRRAEARIRRNDDDMDVDTAQASTPPLAQEAPPSERARAPGMQTWGENSWEWGQEAQEDL
eukprot:2012186-Alexandrium_andersonii.AAC.1